MDLLMYFCNANYGLIGYSLKQFDYVFSEVFAIHTNYDFIEAFCINYGIIEVFMEYS